LFPFIREPRPPAPTLCGGEKDCRIAYLLLRLARTRAA
jgi:hypothetical protein